MTRRRPYYVFEMQAEHFAGSESALEHQQHHRPVPPPPQRANQRFDLVALQRARQPLHRFDAHHTPDGTLAAGRTDKRAMAFGDSGQSGVRALLDGVLGQPTPRDDQVLVERRNGSKDAIDGCWRQARCRVPIRRSGQDQVEPLSRASSRNLAEIPEQRQRLWRPKAIEAQFNMIQEAIEVQKIVGVRRKRVGRAITAVKVLEESSNFWDRSLLVVQKLK